MDNDETEIENNKETHHEEHTTHRRKRRMKSHHAVAGVIVLIILLAVAGLAWLYTGRLTSAKEKIFTKVPLPAAIVDMKFVSAKEAFSRIELAKQLLESQGQKESANASETFNQLLDTKKIAAIEDKHKVSVSNESIDEEYNNLVTQYGGGNKEKFQAELDKSYHMSADKFKNEVIRQELMQAELSLWYSKQENLNQDSYKKANDLKSKIEGGQSFDEVATAYTQDEATKDFAGDSKMIAFKDLLPEFRAELDKSKVGDLKLVASRYGLHLFKVLELNNDGPDGAKQIHLQQIFVKQVGFEDWLKKEVDSIRIIKLLKFS